MGKALALIALATLGGCLWEKNLAERPARLQLGMNTRHVTVETPVNPEVQLGGYAARVTDPPPAPESEVIASNAVTGSAQFTMGYRSGLYFGGEVEAGPMSRSGSFVGGAYGVAGWEAVSPRGSLSLEAIAGRRWVRYELGAEDIGTTALEPRVRGQLWLGPQVTVGGVIGANAIPEERGWMAGIYVGIYSHEHGVKPPPRR